jgi:AsmA family
MASIGHSLDVPQSHLSARFTAADLERAVAQVGLGRNASLANVVIDGSADLFVKDGDIRLASRGMKLNSAALLGDLTISPVDSAGVRRLVGRLNTTDASFPRLLDLLLDPRGVKPTNTDDQAWSKISFDLARWANLDGQVRIEARQLLLKKGLALQSAVLEAKIGGGRIDVTALDGVAAGGRLTSKWSLAPAKTGAIVAGSITLTGSQLQQLPDLTTAQQTSDTQSTGVFDASITLAGQGSSPAAVISTLAGNGMIELRDAKIFGNTPETLQAVIDGAMVGKVDLPPEALERALQTASLTGQMSIDHRKIGVAVVGGIASANALTLATPDGTVTNRTTVDLSNFKYDIEWRIDVASQKGNSTTSSTVPNAIEPKQTWPSVSVVHLGHLGEPELSVQRTSLQALARELTVRKMERDVAELERIRLLDEDLIKIETERLRASAHPATSVDPTLPERAYAVPLPEPENTTNSEDTKRRAAEKRAIEARRPQPAARKTEQLQLGPSP